MPFQHLRRAFTLVELLVVIGIIALLISILLPSLNRARAAAKTTVELSQIRQMETAHVAYANDNDFRFIDAGLGHGAEADDEQGAWITTLQKYYDNPLVLRSPVDDSPHWEGGDGGPVSVNAAGEPRYRRTSYGINDFTSSLVTDANGEPRYAKVTQMPEATSTVHFLIMPFTGEFAAADHPHSESWGVPGFSGAVLTNADDELAMAAHGGERATWDAKSVYGFLDGHAEARTFRQVWNGTKFNASAPPAQQYVFLSAFDPATAGLVQR